MQSPKDAMPWVGLYVAVASLICTLAMAADVVQGFRQRKLWFPCRFFTINAASLTLIAIAMKLPVDLTTDMMPDRDWNAIEKRGESIRTAAQILGKSKKILNILEERQLPELDLYSMAYIDKWHALSKRWILNGCASSTAASPSSNESVTVTIM
ncbi:hypothetical protein OROHE_019307 [Orobanche hederae]